MMDELDFMGQKAKICVKVTFFEKDCLVKIDTADNFHYQQLIEDVYQLDTAGMDIRMAIEKGMRQITELYWKEKEKYNE